MVTSATAFLPNRSDHPRSKLSMNFWLISLRTKIFLLALILPVLIAARLSASFNPDSPLFTRVPGRVVVPAHFSAHALFVDVSINGHGPYRMLVDTGASVSLITPAVAAAVGAQEDDSEETPLDSRNGFGDATDVSSVMLHTVEMNGAQFEGVRAGVTSGLAPIARASGQRVDGVLGFSLFSDVFVALDFPSHQLVLDSVWPTNLAPIRAELDVRETHEIPIVSGRLQGFDLDVSIDTGSNRGLQISPDVARPLSWKAEPRPGPLVNVIGETGREFMGRVGGEFHLNGVTQTEPIVAISEGAPSLGVEFLQHFCVVFDQSHDKMWLCAAKDELVPSPAERSLGLSLLVDDAGWRVAGTIPGSPAEGVGIVSGDVVTCIEGKPAGKWSRDQINALTLGHKQVALSFTHERSSRDVVLAVWSLVP